MKQRISFLLACVFLCLTGCRASGAEQTFFAMDTVMSVQVSGRRGPQAVAVDPDVAELLAFSQEIARQLPGDFDITIAPVMDAWGFTTEERHVPAPDALAAAMALVDSEELSVDTEASAASLARAGMEVDLGAVAKGFAAREAEAAIRDAGGTSAMLDLGGNVTVIGAKEDGSPWRVAVKDPRDTGSYLCVLALTDVTLSTSGGYERYFEEDGVRYHHIIDPETGYPADSGLLSVTVVSADHLLADALSTALLVAAAAVALLFFLQPEESNFLTASVVLEGETIAEYELSTLTGPVTLVVDEAPYPLTIQAEPGRIRIAESACPSQDCVHTGWISRAGQQIICLPDKLVISLSGSGSQEFDAISG